MIGENEIGNVEDIKEGERVDGVERCRQGHASLCSFVIDDFRFVRRPANVCLKRSELVISWVKQNAE